MVTYGDDGSDDDGKMTVGKLKQLLENYNEDFPIFFERVSDLDYSLGLIENFEILSTNKNNLLKIDNSINNTKCEFIRNVELVPLNDRILLTAFKG